MSTGAGNLGVLIPKIAAVLKNMNPIWNPTIKLRNLFRDFWFYCVVLGFDVPYSGKFSFFIIIFRIMARGMVLRSLYNCYKISMFNCY